MTKKQCHICGKTINDIIYWDNGTWNYCLNCSNQIVNKLYRDNMIKKRFTLDDKIDFEDKIETLEIHCIRDNYDNSFYIIADNIDNVKFLLEKLNKEEKSTYLIDKKIKKLQNKYEFGQKQGFCPMHNILHTINTLKKLKEEIQRGEK